MHELQSQVIINNQTKLMMFWYANDFCERSKTGGDDSKRSEQNWMAGVNKMSGSEWWEQYRMQLAGSHKVIYWKIAAATGSAVSTRF